MLLILSLVALLYAEAAAVGGGLGFLGRAGIPAAALLMPAGFLFSSMGQDVAAPNRLVIVIYIGALCLTLGLVALAIGLLQG